MSRTASSPDGRITERFFKESEYWRAWSDVPDLTADIPYALRAVRASDRRVLDVPCGRGRLLKAVGETAPGAALYGLDVNDRMVALTAHAVPRARVQVASVYAIPYRDRSFDAVLCHESFMHFAEPHVALAELTRVARERVYVSVTTRRQLNSLLRRWGLLAASDVPHWSYDLEDLRALLPDSFEWTIVGGFLVGRKALRLSHAAHRRLHERLGRRLPQWILRRFGQTLFAYGIRRG